MGCDEIIATLRNIRAVVQLAESKGQDPNDKVSFNYLFMGNPGTGAAPAVTQQRTTLFCFRVGCASGKFLTA